MSTNKIGKIPDFTPNDPVGEEFVDVNKVSVPGTETPVEQPSTGEEKETPSEPPAEQEPAESGPEPVQGDDTGALSELKGQLRSEIEGMARDRKDLILELNDLRDQRRTAREVELQKLKEEVDDLKDLNPQDVNVVDRIIKAKGYVSQSQLDTMLFEARKQDEIARFLNLHPEYNEENDPDRKKFERLLQGVKLYRTPEDPKEYGTFLMRAQRALAGAQGSSERDLAIKRRQVEIAGVGAGGVQRSSSVKSFDQRTRQHLLDGGWSEEDITNMEKRQSQ